MDVLLLSPKATYFPAKASHGARQEGRVDRRKGSFSCCSRCKRSLEQDGKNPPKFAIANGFAIGMPEDFLSDLNEIELALVSLNRNMSHVFSLYGGQHKQMKGFHAMMRSDVTHTSTSLATVKQMTGKDKISCVLSGPFTGRQHEKAMAMSTVTVDRVISAYTHLHETNHIYRALPVPTGEDVPEPIIIDDRYVFRAFAFVAGRPLCLPTESVNRAFDLSTVSIIARCTSRRTTP